MKFNSQMLEFISRSPTPYHAVENCVSILLEAGYKQLFEAEEWSLMSGGKYFVTRRDSSLIAFQYGANSLIDAGIRVLGAHTDSPCLKVKAEPDIKKHGYKQVGVDVYGGVLLSPWFDRDLSIAGKVSFLSGQTELRHTLIDFRRPIATIPNLAIHLDRNANSERSINPHSQMLPILWQSSLNGVDEFRSFLRSHLIAQGESVTEVLDFDLSFYDVQAGSIVGVYDEFLTCARLDNLLSCYVTVQSLLENEGNNTCVVVLNDHEEVGSSSTAGAAGNFFKGVLDRLVPNVQNRHRVESQSMMMSVDNAHGIHPNFAEKHDVNHAPKLNGGPVLKFDVNQSYASQSVMSSLVRMLAKKIEIPLQAYSVRADMRCGSTIGPITATATGIETLDIGVPTFAMHSIRELAGSHDAIWLKQLLVEFINYKK